MGSRIISKGEVREVGGVGSCFPEVMMKVRWMWVRDDASVVFCVASVSIAELWKFVRGYDDRLK